MTILQSTALRALLTLGTLAGAQAEEPLVFAGYARAPWLSSPTHALSRSLKEVSDHSWWSQLSPALRHSMARAKQPGGGVYFGSFQVLGITAPDREIRVLEVLRREVDPPGGAGPFNPKPREVQVTVRYAVAPQASPRPRNAVVLRFRRSVSVRCELVDWPAPAAGGLSAALGGAGEAELEGVNEPDLTFAIAHGGDCRILTPVTLAETSWDRLRELFATPSASAAEERARIGQAVALLERLTGPLAGTAGDLGGWSGNASGLGAGQQDCLDETANTTTYLGLLLRDGLLRFHRPAAHQLRGGIHFAASMREVHTGQLWVVDAWVRDNGERPTIQTLADWRKKKPDQAP